eukprot:CAMPEP_0197898436 /NCGR_PEP_ID=MMETSP1439-20131203/44039_1 /TAXON_ID=66791 /ORGANISM="Gonyaulax spinifera, Strain CCMP409" /LENGTH=78 /DNA_ID=CAMNT_0043519155 /DNA_START=21 /DNA_END=255 /DNA_ORIENTATION=-
MPYPSPGFFLPMHFSLRSASKQPINLMPALLAERAPVLAALPRRQVACGGFCVRRGPRSAARAATSRPLWPLGWWSEK